MSHQGQLCGFLNEYISLERGKLVEINSFKRQKEGYSGSERDHKKNMTTMILKELRPIQEKKQRMQKIVDLLAEADISIETLEKSMYSDYKQNYLVLD